MRVTGTLRAAERHVASGGRTYPVVAAALKTARKARGLTPAQLAHLAGCHPSMVNHLEAGRKTRVTADLGDALASHLGIPPADLSQAPDPTPDGTTVPVLVGDGELA